MSDIEEFRLLIDKIALLNNLNFDKLWSTVTKRWSFYITSNTRWGRIKSIDLGNCNISKLPEKTFSGFRWLKVLLLSQNSLKEIPTSCFAGLRRLYQLDLCELPIRKLSPKVFDSLEYLEDLHMLSTNITHLEPESFRSLYNLKHLNLSSNNSLRLQKDNFHYLENLRSLYLSNCGISNLPKEVFNGLQNLKNLNLSCNKLNWFSIKHLETFPFLRSLNLRGNPLEELFPTYPFRFPTKREVDKLRTKLSLCEKIRNTGIIEEPLNRYISLGSKLSEGKAGEVYIAKVKKKLYELELATFIAVKIYKPEILRYNNQEKRIMRELNVGRKLNHPNMLKFYYLGRYNKDRISRICLLMEYIEGENLSKWKDHNNNLTYDEIKKIILQLLNVVVFLHENSIIHRDIKPANIMIMKDELLVLLDYGVIKSINDSKSITGSNQFVGTIRYADPNFLLGEYSNRKEIDYYSIGAILYYLIMDKEIYDSEYFVHLIIHKHNGNGIEYEIDVTENNEEMMYLLDISKELLDQDPNKRPNLEEVINKIKHIHQLPSC